MAIAIFGIIRMRNIPLLINNDKTILKRGKSVKKKEEINCERNSKNQWKQVEKEEEEKGEVGWRKGTNRDGTDGQHSQCFMEQRKLLSWRWAVQKINKSKY